MSLAVRISNIKKGLTPPIIYNSLLSENGIFGWEIVGFWDVWIGASSHLSSICIFFLKNLANGVIQDPYWAFLCPLTLQSFVLQSLDCTFLDDYYDHE